MNRTISHADTFQIIGNGDNYVIKFQTIVPEMINNETVQNTIAQDTSVFIKQESLAELSRIINRCLAEKVE